MKKLLVVTGILALFFLMISDYAFAKSRENKAACLRWCNANKPRCVKCDSNAFCDGRELDVIAKFTEGSGNWYACGLSESEANTRRNRDECKAWCGRNSECEFCKDYKTCGSDHTAMKTFGARGERGEKWYACKPDRRESASRQNEQDCKAWCGRDERCEFCKDRAGCGRGYTSIKKFGGRGENWHACANRDRLSQLRKAECEAWCERDERCKYCKDSVGCGEYNTSIKKFGGRGENWYACGSLEKYKESKSNREECLEYCAKNPDCDFCAGKRNCTSAIEPIGLSSGFSSDRLKTFGGRGHNYYACRINAKGSLTKERLEECERLCNSSDFCDFCTTNRSRCGAGKKVVVRFRGRGETVYGCKNR